MRDGDDHLREGMGRERQLSTENNHKYEHGMGFEFFLGELSALYCLISCRSRLAHPSSSRAPALREKKSMVFTKSIVVSPPRVHFPPRIN